MNVIYKDKSDKLKLKSGGKKKCSQNKRNFFVIEDLKVQMEVAKELCPTRQSIL
jgi:hypothetical protein